MLKVFLIFMTPTASLAAVQIAKHYNCCDKMVALAFVMCLCLSQNVLFLYLLTNQSFKINEHLRGFFTLRYFKQYVCFFFCSLFLIVLVVAVVVVAVSLLLLRLMLIFLFVTNCCCVHAGV